MSTNRGIAPLVILAIIGLLAVGTGGAVYVTKTRNASNVSTDTSLNLATTSKSSSTQVVDEPGVKVVASSSPAVVPKASDQSATTKPAPLKTATKSIFVIPATPTMQASNVKTFRQALTYGRDLVCTYSGGLAWYGKQGGSLPVEAKTKLEYYFSPAMPGIYGLLQHNYPPNVAENEFQVKIFDWNKKNMYYVTVAGNADPDWTTIRSTPGSYTDESKLNYPELLRPSHLDTEIVNAPCVEQTFDHSILDGSKYTFAKSYDYYLKSGKDWECTFKNEYGEGGTYFSRLYPERWYHYSVGYPGSTYSTSVSHTLAVINESREYNWGGYNNNYIYSQYGSCHRQKYSLPETTLRNCVEKPQNASLFELPKDHQFTKVADYSGDCR